MKNLKSILPVIISFILIFSSGCSKNEEVVEEVNRTLKIDELGITFTPPEEWIGYEEKNIFPMSVQSDGTFAQLKYYYLPSEDYDNINSGNYDVSLADVLYNICEIAIVKNENINNVSVQNLFSTYNKKVLIGEQQGFEYYLLYDYNGDISNLNDEQTDIYHSLSAVATKISDSASLFEFDQNLITNKVEDYNRTLSFITTTLEGNDINSSIFAEYSYTLLNFSGSYFVPSMEEMSTLQKVFERIKSENLDVNVLTAIIDTPSPEAESIALKAKTVAGAEFEFIILDDALADWVTKNLKGLPTTVLVDNQGKIVTSDYIEGVRTVDEYMEEIYNVID